jgi:hypothetical protein
MSCFDDDPTFVSTNQKPHATKHELQNLPLIETCQVLTNNLMRILMLGQPEPPKHIPPKHVTFPKLYFGPISPSSMFPHVIPIHAPENNGIGFKV